MRIVHALITSVVVKQELDDACLGFPLTEGSGSVGLISLGCIGSRAYGSEM